MTVYIGSVLGGGDEDNLAISQAERKLCAAVADLQRDRPPGAVHLDIVFHIPGYLFGPDYEGVRTGSFFRDQNLKQIQIAVPRDLPPSEFKAFFRDSIRLGMEKAVKSLKRRGINYSMEADAQLVDEALDRVFPDA